MTSITCPQCGLTSHNAHDLLHRYCGKCHQFHADMKLSTMDDLRRARDRITELETWIKAANQFAWAHEHGCPRYEKAGPCTCGLDQFLGRPRPFIESYKQQLAEANQKIAELYTMDDLRRAAAGEIINCMGLAKDAGHPFIAAYGRTLSLRLPAIADGILPLPEQGYVDLLTSAARSKAAEIEADWLAMLLSVYAPQEPSKPEKPN